MDRRALRQPGAEDVPLARFMITLRQFVQKGILTAAALVFLGNTLSAEEAPRIWLTPTNDEAGKLTIHWQLRDETQTESILRFGKLGDESMQAVPVGKEQGIYRADVDISELDMDWQFQIDDGAVRPLRGLEKSEIRIVAVADWHGNARPGAEAILARNRI